MLLLDSQVELVVLFVFLSRFLVDAASSTPVHYCISYNYREGPSVVLTLRVKLFAWQIQWEPEGCSAHCSICTESIVLALAPPTFTYIACS